MDFIYGNEPMSLFNDCKLVFSYNANKNSGYVSAPKASASEHMVLHSLTVRFSQKRDAQEVSIILQDLGEQMLILLGLTAIWVRY